MSDIFDRIFEAAHPGFFTVSANWVKVLPQPNRWGAIFCYFHNCLVERHDVQGYRHEFWGVRFSRVRPHDFRLASMTGDFNHWNAGLLLVAVGGATQ